MKKYLGIDLGGTNIAVGLVDDNKKIIAKYSVPTGASRPFEAVVADMAGAARELLRKKAVEESEIEYVGIGAPSTISPESNLLIFANNLGWKEVDLAGEFRKNWDISTLLANDADCAALGEGIGGAASGYDNVLVVTLGTGLGGGIVMNKKLFLGGDGFGFEPGHSVLVHDGILCTCGNKGCLESYASVTALVRQTIDRMISCPESIMWKQCGRDLNRVNGRTAFDAARKGDEAAKQVVEEYISYLATGLANLITLFRPQAVVVGGGLSNEGDFLLEPLRKMASRRIYAPDQMTMPPILQAKLGNDAGIIGAALLGLE